MGHVLLVRHISTAGNNPPPGKPKLHRGVKDIPPSPEGIRQSKSLAKNLVKANPSIIRLVSSPLLRTMDMMEEIQDAQGDDLKIEISEDCNTWDTGKLAGRPMDDVKPILVAYSGPKRAKKWPAMRESFEDFLKRWLSFLSALLDHPKPGTIVVGTQGTNIGTALEWDRAGRKPDYANLSFNYAKVETVKPAHWVTLKEEGGHTPIYGPDGKEARPSILVT
jgi:broad specificity phosphatase PhoE